MGWFKRNSKTSAPEPSKSAEEVIRFYQQLGFFSKSDPASVMQRYADDVGELPAIKTIWDDVFLLRYSDGDVWAEDPEADVCAENEIYSEVVAEWGNVSQGAFMPTNICEHWKSDRGPITVTFQLDGRNVSISPNYQDDWIDLEILQKINAFIATSGRQFECAVDGNFALVVCLTPDQKRTIRSQRQFPFAW